MRNAYALLGLTFIIVGIGVYLAFERVDAPRADTLPEPNELETAMDTPFVLSSPAFADGERIPKKYTCDGENTSIPLTWKGVPEGTESLVLLMDDPDIPEEIQVRNGIEKFDHWTVFNIPADTTDIQEGIAPDGVVGLNGAGENAYTGPCPPSAYEPAEHRYFFRLYALDTRLMLEANASQEAIRHAMETHIIGEAELVGRYERVQ